MNEEQQQLNPVQQDKPVRPRRGMGRNIVTDPAAPEYYSERAIYWFSILLLPLFGAIMMSVNLKKVDKKASRQIVLFAAIYMILEGIIASRFQSASWLSLIFNIIGVVLIDQIYWKPYIGAETKYRAKPIWKPLIIAVVITIVVVFALVVTGQA